MYLPFSQHNSNLKTCQGGKIALTSIIQCLRQVENKMWEIIQYDIQSSKKKIFFKSKKKSGFPVLLFCCLERKNGITSSSEEIKIAQWSWSSKWRTRNRIFEAPGYRTTKHNWWADKSKFIKSSSTKNQETDLVRLYTGNLKEIAVWIILFNIAFSKLDVL